MSLVNEGKAILSLINKAANRELYEKLMEYLDKVFALTSERASLQEDNVKVRAELSKVAEQLAFSKKLTLREEAYWVDEDPHPYCMRCWDKDKAPIRLKKIHGRSQCPECEVIFNTPSWS